MRLYLAALFPFSFAVSLFSAEPPARSAPRPNILWVVFEDATFNYVGPYGDPQARTPNIDRLAAKGITFDRAQCPSPVCAPTRSTIITGRYAVSLGTQHMRSRMPLPSDVKFLPEFLRAAGYYCTNAHKTDYNTSTSFAGIWNENGPLAHWRHRAPGQPFFAVFNFEESHEDTLHTRKPLITDPARVRVPAYLPDVPVVRADLAQYYDDVSRADAAIGRVLAELAEDGLADDTIVFCYSDNGGSVSRSKRMLYDNGTHIALVATFPEKFAHLAPAAPGSHTAELVSFVDLAPTVLSLAGLPLPVQFQGHAFAGPGRTAAPATAFLFRDRMDERIDFSRAVTDGRFRYIRNYYPDQPWGQHIDYQWKQASQREWERLYHLGQLTRAQRAFFEPKPAEELFDDISDPDNVHNLAADPDYSAVRERLQAALHDQIIATRDTGFLPEPMMVAHAAGGSPTTIASDPEFYPLEQITSFVDASQLHLPEDAALATACRAKSPALRYWAAVVARHAKQLPNDCLKLLDDDEACVRVTASESILQRADSPAAWQILLAELNDALPLTRRVFVLNALARVTRPFPAEIQSRLTALAKPGEKIAAENYIMSLARPILAR